MPLYIVGFAIVAGLGALLWRRYQSGGEWQRDASFFVDLLAMGAAAVIVGTLAFTQLKSEPFDAPVAAGESAAEPSPSPEASETRRAIVPSVTLTPRRTATQRAQGAATPEATIPMTTTATVSATITTTVATTATATAAATASQVQTYVVQAGDRLNTIAARFGLTSAQIIAANPGLNADTLQIDQRLIIPTSAPGAPPPPPPTAVPAPVVRTYTVQPGDYLNTIAARFGVTTTQIIALNPGLSADSLSIGQVIRLP